MSSSVTRFAAACAAGLMLAATPALAQSTQPAGTTVEFTTATRLPGITLEPGKYLFRLGPPATPKIVEVYSADGTKKIATLVTVDYTVAAPANATTVLYENTNPPVLRAWYAPGETIGREFVYSGEEAATLGQVARTVADAAKQVAKEVRDVTAEIWDDIEDNVRLVNPTASRKAAERHLDAAEKAYDDLEDRVSDDVERRLMPVKTSLEALEDAFEKDLPWMTHYTTVMASIDALAPEKPVGTSGGAPALDASTHAALMSIRAHLRAFHAQAM